MKLSVILTVASLCLARLAVAAPVTVPEASEIVNIDENGEKHVNLEYFLSSIEAIYDSDSAISEIDQKKFVVDSMEEVKEQGLLGEFAKELVNIFQLEDSETDDVSKRSGYTEKHDTAGDALVKLLSSVFNYYVSKSVPENLAAKPGSYHVKSKNNG